MTPEPEIDTTGTHTVVHLVRHGQVHNPVGLISGRLPDYHLSETGRAMADLVAEHLRGRDVVHLRCSPLERAQETKMEPIIWCVFGLPVTTDGRVIEADDYLEGIKVTLAGTIRRPQELVAVPRRPAPDLGRALHRDRRADAAGRARRRGGRPRSRGRHRVPPAADLDGPRRRRGPPARPRPAPGASATWPASPRSRCSTAGYVAVDYTEPAAELYTLREPRKFVAGASGSPSSPPPPRPPRRCCSPAARPPGRTSPPAAPTSRATSGPAVRSRASRPTSGRPRPR